MAKFDLENGRKNSTADLLMAIFFAHSSNCCLIYGRVPSLVKKERQNLMRNFAHRPWLPTHSVFLQPLKMCQIDKWGQGVGT
jgi:hypothetical protein